MSDNHPTQSDDTPPCPFCGEADIAPLRLGKDEVTMSCGNCGAQGPLEAVWADDEEHLHDAIMRAAWAWARRAR
jgi:transcription elongation factor Elf1